MTELPEIENNGTDERSHLWLSIGRSFAGDGVVRAIPGRRYLYFFW